jgi:acyl carrier protein
VNEPLDTRAARWEPTPTDIREAVVEYLLRNHLPDETAQRITDSRPLVTAGILDSIASLELVWFLEERYGIAIEAHEVDVENLDTVGDIVRFVQSKLMG